MAQPRFSVTRDDTNPVCILHLAGELDLSVVDQFQQALMLALCDQDVALHLANLTFMDSTALGALVQGFRKAKGLGLRIYLVQPHPAIQRLLQVAQVRQFLPVYPNLREALQAAAAHRAVGNNPSPPHDG